MSNQQQQLQNIGRQLNKFLIKQDKSLPGSSIPKSFIIFLFNLLIILPIFLLILIPLAISYQIGNRIFGQKSKIMKIDYLEVNEVAKDIKPQKERKYDIIVFGATGFTGNLAVKYLTNNYKAGVSWAIAGRSQSKLEKVRNKLIKINENLGDLPILIADSSNEEQLRQVAQNTRAIVSTVGPYAKYGTNLVAICAEYGTHYCDITGEVAWVRCMIEKYDSLASKSGAILISCCGCDSIPWDILTYRLNKELQDQYKQNMTQVQLFDYMKGNFSGGSFATLQFLVENRAKKSSLGYDPLLKAIGVNKKSQNETIPVIQRFIGYNSIIGKFVGMWALADGNAGIVKRSNALLNYSNKLIYKESMVYDNFFAGFNIQMGNLILGALLMLPPLLKAIKKYVFPQPGEGPSEKEMEVAFLTVRGIGIGDQGQLVSGLINFPNDPGYVDTARMIIETGLCLAKDQDKIIQKGGYYTPSSGVGDALIERLVKTGSKLEIQNIEKKQQ